MERLTYRNHEQTPFMHYDGVSDETTIRQTVIKLAAYEDAEEQGRLIVLPVPIGTEIYRLVSPFGKPEIVKIQAYPLCNDARQIGKTVFLTREAAEAALKANNDSTGG